MTKEVAALLLFCIFVFATLHLKKVNAEEVISCYAQCKKDCLKEGGSKDFCALKCGDFCSENVKLATVCRGRLSFEIVKSGIKAHMNEGTSNNG
ncbi:hypothetical protein Syun_023267 [Stephania yunnanensis]|uniref:Uncharacterized protein n=1 Tax=Stephania yunnanensis TaxID=152371 RepID=A0AAP0F8P8_9MAGN